jgi:heptosyltransferase-2
MKRQILIIKTGATGDVVRTSVLLHIFANDEITWVTAEKNKCVLPDHFPALSHVIAIEDVTDCEHLKNDVFDWGLSLDDDIESVKLASSLSCKKLTGAFYNVDNQKMEYTDDSAAWFDLSLISRYDKEIADKMKYEATKSVQAYLCDMVGHTFAGEEYLIPEEITAKPNAKLIGIEERAGARWPTKRWNGYEELSQKLEKMGYEVRFFKERSDMRDYMRDIADCSLIITGDTLAMHFALALKIPTVAIFTCTSPDEIYDYGRMEKVISPFLWKAFYKTAYIPEAVESITLKMVWDAIEKVGKIEEII